jgi:GNAT superfamily N-acetyltransferase
MAHAERLATAMGYGEIRLYTNARFVDNVALYQRLGYAIAREESFLGGRVAHMSKRLPPA